MKVWSNQATHNVLQITRQQKMLERLVFWCGTCRTQEFPNQATSHLALELKSFKILRNFDCRIPECLTDNKPTNIKIILKREVTSFG